MGQTNLIRTQFCPVELITSSEDNKRQTVDFTSYFKVGDLVQIPQLAPAATETDIGVVTTKTTTPPPAPSSGGKVCAKCGDSLEGAYVSYLSALGKFWHPEHFTCALCPTSLGTVPFYTHDGKPYCEDHKFGV